MTITSHVKILLLKTGREEATELFGTRVLAHSPNHEAWMQEVVENELEEMLCDRTELYPPGLYSIVFTLDASANELGPVRVIRGLTATRVTKADYESYYPELRINLSPQDLEILF